MPPAISTAPPPVRTYFADGVRLTPAGGGTGREVLWSFGNGTDGTAADGLILRCSCRQSLRHHPNSMPLYAPHSSRHLGFTSLQVAELDGKLNGQQEWLIYMPPSRNLAVVTHASPASVRLCRQPSYVFHNARAWTWHPTTSMFGLTQVCTRAFESRSSIYGESTDGWVKSFLRLAPEACNATNTTNVSWKLSRPARFDRAAPLAPRRQRALTCGIRR